MMCKEFINVRLTKLFIVTQRVSNPPLGIEGEVAHKCYQRRLWPL